MSQQIITADISYIDTSVSPNTTETLRVSTRSVTGDSFNVYQGLLSSSTSYKLKLSVPQWGGASSIAIGTLGILNTDGVLDDIVNAASFRDQTVTIKSHFEGDAEASWTTLLVALIERADVSLDAVRLVLRDPGIELHKPIPMTSYTSGDALGKLKPISFGNPKSVKPILTDSATNAYDVVDSGLAAIDVVYVAGVDTFFSKSSTGFTLDASASGQIVCDPVASATGELYSGVPAEANYLTVSENAQLVTEANDTSPQDGTCVLAQNGIANAPFWRNSADGGKYYFEVVWNNNATSSGTVWSGSGAGTRYPSVGSHSHDIAVGITSAAPVHPQSPLHTGWYGYGIDQTSSDDIQWDKLDNGSLTSSAGSYLTTLGSLTGYAFGVAVDFDSSPMTVQCYPIAGGLQTAIGIPAGSYAPFIGLSGQASFNRQMYLRLTADQFVRTVPSGYSAWSSDVYTADSTFSDLVTSITDKVSVTFNSASVTAVSNLVHSSPEQQYTYAYHYDSTVKAVDILSRALSGIGGYYYVNKTGEVVVGQLTAPGAAVDTIENYRILDDVTITLDTAPELTDGAGANFNWSRMSEAGFASTSPEIPASLQDTLSSEFRDEYRGATALALPYDHAISADLFPSLLVSAEAAQQEADRLAALYSVVRRFYTFKVGINTAGNVSDETLSMTDYVDNIGNTFTVELGRYSGTVDLVLIGVDLDFGKPNQIQLTFWG